jgi:aspartyl-tRNA(Asn)/glutamyl-tRNA(Gln) amidotransferase subunit B
MSACRRGLSDHRIYAFAMKWETVIGLETHAQLSTVSKIFSGAATAFGASPNTQACAVDIALPGVLPVMNKGAVERAIRFGLAVGGRISPRSVFARKNYFYPDLPKGYQISQYELPIVEGGSLTIHVGEHEKTVRLTRAHLEEDAGKSLHEDFHGASGIDLNRAGTPLLEIVSEPDMSSSAEAVAYAKALHALVRWIGICDGNMQEGSFRCDANVSVRPAGSDKLGTRREIKNLNSFRFLQQAIDYEVQWQINEIEEGRKIVQATVLFDPTTGTTRMMRTKEDAHDYRYFPDPDLLPLEVTAEQVNEIRNAMPLLPSKMQARFAARSYEADQEWENMLDAWVHEAAATVVYGLTEKDAKELSADLDRAEYFVRAVDAAGGGNAKLCANWILGDLAARLNQDDLEIRKSKVSATQLGKLVLRIADGTISGKIAKDIFDTLWAAPVGGADEIDNIIKNRGLQQISDVDTIEKIVDDVLAANAQQVADYKAGKEKAFNSLVGQVMKATKGKANPQQVNDLLKRKLVG